MIEYDQGYILRVGLAERRDLIIVFGRMGFTGYTPDWNEFRRSLGKWDNIRDPFREWPGTWIKYNPGKWVVFLGPTRNNGMYNAELSIRLRAILSEAKYRGVTSVITNGIKDANRPKGDLTPKVRADRRAELIDKLIRRHDGSFSSVKLISASDVFLRLAERLKSHPV